MMKSLIIVGVSAAFLAACASAPQRSEQIDEARAQIEILSQDPLAQQAAGRDLDAARGKLQEAEGAQQRHEPPAVVDHLAYLARRHAEAGEARTSEARSRDEVARAEHDRNQVLLDARSREAQSAKNQALEAKDQAQQAKDQAQAATAEALAAQAALANAQQQLADLQAKKTDRGTVVTLGDVLFDTGQATLKPGASLILTRLADFMNDNPQTKLIIEGHTDSRGSDEYNEALSQRRAQAVATELMSRGVPTQSLQTVGRGKNYPVATNDTPAGRQQNRRVEIVFSDASGRFAQGATSQPVLR
jgi:outer membrane protein OmpA-like peptidoglycan-associated protein